MGVFDDGPARESDYYWNNTDFSRRLRFARAMVGTDKGVFTARIDTKNPKTKDGKNTVIFRRSPAETVLEVQGAPVLKAAEKALPEGIKVGDKSIRYTPQERTQIRTFVKKVAKAQIGNVENPDFGTIVIGRDFVREVQTHAISTAREIASVSSAREIASRMKHFAAAPNEEVKAGKNKYIEYGLAKFEFDGSTYLVMGEVGVRKNFTPYYDQRVVAKLKAESTPGDLHAVEEPISALDEIYDNRFRMLLQGVNEFNKTGVSAQGENLRMSRSGIFTGTAADYANRSRQGGVDDGPSVKKIGTGEGSQVYGWGLRGTTIRKNAERDSFGKRQKNLYKQTFFTNRVPGDESHLLDWNGTTTLEQKQWFADEANKEFGGNWIATERGLREGDGPRFDDDKGWKLYNIAKMLVARNKYTAGRVEQLASEFLYRAGIDGVKAPDIRYGKTSDKDELGNIYVAFSDEHIRVDHKWTDGQMRYSRSVRPSAPGGRHAEVL